jgi:hypothetical protein
VQIDHRRIVRLVWRMLGYPQVMGLLTSCVIPEIDISLHEMRFILIGPIAIGPYDIAH